MAAKVTEQRQMEKEGIDAEGVERTATQQEIKKAYKNLALRLHPDKNPGDEVISILGDEEKRSNYDRTGTTDDDAFFYKNCDEIVIKMLILCLQLVVLVELKLVVLVFVLEAD
ncbi:chaperone protein dnaJ 6-like protein [Carex littledalei]|uniref:Chaperone protein dnaJ 6-like protein n=1 Tax=Carex littledalei TaxID=544730 RepID=A0A833RD12_9POAL|nr:chaperone protein dnaJ 6-like protein [Carex littledalei]